MVLPGATDILPDTPLPAGMLSTPPAQIRKYLPPCSPCPSCFWKEDCPRFKGFSHPEWEAALAQLINLKTQKKALEEEIGELESRLKVAYQLSHTVKGEWINTGNHTFRVLPQNGRVTLDRKRLNEELETLLGEQEAQMLMARCEKQGAPFERLYAVRD